MSEYMLVKREHLEQIANAIKSVSGQNSTLTFPEDFENTIRQFSYIPPVVPPSTQTLSLSYVTGNDVTDSNRYPHTGYVAVGHSSSKIKNDAVWSFSPTINASTAIFTFSWNNTTDIGTNVGWGQPYDYAFSISTNRDSGQYAVMDSNKIVENLTGVSGTATIEFNNLNLQAGTTYYIRANFNGDTTSTLKAFAKNNNTVSVTE